MSDYIFPCVVVRSREVDLLSREETLKLLELDSVQDIMNVLAEHGYGDGKELENPRDFEAILSKNMEEMYKIYAFSKSNDAVSYEPETLHGIVTGIINSNNKTGVFVEIADKYITGLTPMSSSELLDYKPGDPIDVKIKEFEIKDSKDPFVYSKKGQIVKSNCRAVFELA